MPARTGWPWAIRGCFLPCRRRLRIGAAYGSVSKATCKASAFAIGRNRLPATSVSTAGFAIGAMAGWKRCFRGGPRTLPRCSSAAGRARRRLASTSSKLRRRCNFRLPASTSKPRSDTASDQPLRGAPQALEDRLVGLFVSRFRVDHVDGAAEGTGARRDAQSAPAKVLSYQPTREIAGCLVGKQEIETERAQIEVHAGVG